MNPGPAPKPPVDRPRLNLTPSTAGLPGNMSSMSLQSSSSASLTSSSSWSSTSVPISRVQTSNGTNGQGGVAIVKQGYAKVKEDGFRGLLWSSKYLILRDFSLDFHKNENSSKITSSVQLKDVTSVSRVDAPQYSFEITRLANPGASPVSSSSGLSLANRDLPQKVIILQMKNDDELYEWMEKIYCRCPSMGGVSNPTNFEHQVHVGFDNLTGAFVGLPPEWERLLTTSAITQEDYQKNPEAVIEVLEFYDNITKRAENPEKYSSLAPTPGTGPNLNKQLGYNMTGASIAPPRQTPSSAPGSQRMDGYNPDGSRQGPSRSENTTPIQNQRHPSVPEQQMQQRQPQQPLSYSTNTSPKGASQQRGVQDQGRQAQQPSRGQTPEEEDDDDDFNTAIPKTRTPMAKQEIGIFGGGGDSPSGGPRYNPSRVAPSAPGGTDRTRQQAPPSSLRQMAAQRQAPSAPGSSGVSNLRPPQVQKSSGSRDASPSSGLRPNQQDLNSRGPPSPRFPTNPQESSSQGRQPANGTSATAHGQNQPPSRLPGPVNAPKPLNVAKQPTGASSSQNTAQSSAVKQAEMALTKKEPAQTREKDVRMSGMSEDQIMTRLREVVSKDDPNSSYAKQKKIGQGASGSVYVAKVLEDARSPTARKILRESKGKKPQVAIKQMDLNSQPRKELIVNEIIVMKESTHPNIVNFLDAFLRQPSELWVVMEYMEGGALTDVIDNNPDITEAQIATICFEVS